MGRLAPEFTRPARGASFDPCRRCFCSSSKVAALDTVETRYGTITVSTMRRLRARSTSPRSRASPWLIAIRMAPTIRAVRAARRTTDFEKHRENQVFIFSRVVDGFRHRYTDNNDAPRHGNLTTSV
jgi:hypothetical protein